MTINLLIRPPATVVPRDVLDACSDLGEVWITLKWAASCLADATEWGDRASQAHALADLKAAHAALGRLVSEIESEIG